VTARGASLTTSRPLLARCWELRQNVSVYDAAYVAAYVALAELLDVVLLTADARLATASGPRCQFEVLSGRSDR